MCLKFLEPATGWQHYDKKQTLSIFYSHIYIFIVYIQSILPSFVQIMTHMGRNKEIYLLLLLSLINMKLNQSLF